jgi:polysaccharide export outer membrane protein
MRRACFSGFVRCLALPAAMLLAVIASSQAVRADDARAQPAAYQPPASIADTYKLGTGDKLRVIVYGEDDLGGTFDVDGNGYVSLPLIGQVKVGGLSAPEVERVITAKFSDGFLKEPRVNVEVSQYRPFYVLGEVNRPGSYPYTDGMSIQNAVADAGGYTQKATEGGVYVRHAGDTKEIYLDSDSAAMIYPGDVVRVPSSLFWDTISILGPLSGFAALYGAYHN